MKRTAYEVLGVAPGAPDFVIQAAYRACLKKYHPDHYREKDASHRTAEVVEAYKNLRSPEARASYDARMDTARPGANQGQPPPPPKSPSPPPTANNRLPDGQHGISPSWVKALVIAGFVALVAVWYASESGEFGETGAAEDAVVEAVAVEEAYSPEPTASEEKVEPSGTLPASDTPISYSNIEDATTRFLSILDDSGMDGARRYSERCHANQSRDPSWQGLDYCAAFDFAAEALDRQMSRELNIPRNSYFSFQVDNQSEHYLNRSSVAYFRLSKIKNSTSDVLADAYFRQEVNRIVRANSRTVANTPNLIASITRQAKVHWIPPQGPDAEKLATIISFDLAQDGSIRSGPTVVSQQGVTEANRMYTALHAERAIRAVQAAAPFDLPADQYDSWKRISALRFE